MSALPEPTVFVSGRIAAGTTLNGVYEVESSLAPGGMGEVYKGHEIFSGKKVALKFIRRELEENTDARQMFVNEGNSLAELHHDAIVRCFPLSVDPALRRLYLPMEFVEGPSLFDLMAAGPIDAAEVLLLLKRIGAGLGAAHERHIFHRDVSPDNIIVPDRDMRRAKLIDFGIARSTESGRATVIGSGFAGKHNYVSPEQCGLYGGDVQAQSDIYSFGLVLAGAALGRPLDMGGSLVEVTGKRQALPNLTGIDARLRPVLEAMLQPDPAKRPPTMADLVDMLTPQATVTSPAPAPPASARRAAPRLGLLVGGGVAAVLLAGVVGAALMLRGGGSSGTVTAADTPIREFVTGFAPQGCVLLQPAVLTAHAADVLAFARDPAAVDAFSPAFEQRFGFKPTVTTLTVDDKQCQVLALARSLGAGRPGAPAMTIDDPGTARKSGRKVAGSIEAPADETVSLYRIDENGTIQDISDVLVKADSAELGGRTAAWSFQPALDRSGDAAEDVAPQVLLAIAGKVLDAPRIELTASASDFLPRLQAALPADAPPSAALAVFDLAK